MSFVSRFIVLIECGIWRRFVAAMAALAVAFTGLAPMTAAAAPVKAKKDKVAKDLRDAVASLSTPKARWAKDVNGVRQVQVVISAKTSEVDMTTLRNAVKAAGGSVHVRMPGLRMVTATLPAAAVATISARSDVDYVVPNRVVQRTASTLELMSGALASNVRTYSAKNAFTGLDGSGVGIAVLDSGVMKNHEIFLNGSTSTRVAKNVQFMNTTQANWGSGTDSQTTSLQPGTTTLTNYEKFIDNSANATIDGYGHGTHVASMAAGRAGTFDYSPDTSGIAPNATIYDVKVLTDKGDGSLSDTLEGMQWVMYHAKEYNIRVMNLSLAAASTDSWQFDPLCAAVRSATAMGITVVVAAGNFGVNALGQEAYGTVSAPANEPSAITVGSVNFKGTSGRADDTVNNFSSRGRWCP
jgi:serine protease AprX